MADSKRPSLMDIPGYAEMMEELGRELAENDPEWVAEVQRALDKHRSVNGGTSA
jgi:hypothetical protein